MASLAPPCTGYRPDEETLSAIHRIQIHLACDAHASTKLHFLKIYSTIHCHSAKTFFFFASPRLHPILSLFLLAPLKRLPLAGHPFLLLLLILIFFNGKKYIILNPLTNFIVYLSRTTSTVNAMRSEKKSQGTIACASSAPCTPTHLHLPPSYCRRRRSSSSSSMSLTTMLYCVLPPNTFLHRYYTYLNKFPTDSSGNGGVYTCIKCIVLCVCIFLFH